MNRPASLRSLSSDVVPALIAVGLQLAIGTVENVPVPLSVLIVTALGAFCVYTADHASGTSREDGRPWRPAYTRVAVATVILILSVVFLPGVRSLTAVLYIGFSILYVVPVSRSLPRLQDLPLIRSVAIVIGWSLIPFLNRDITGSAGEAVWMSGMALMLAAAHLLSDWKDAAADHVHQRPTVASRLSYPTLKWSCWGLLGAASLLFCLHPATRVMTPGALLFFCHSTLRGLWQTARVGDLFLLWGWVAWAISQLAPGL